MLLVMSDTKPKQSLKVKQCIYCDTLCDLKDVKCCNCGSHKFRKYNKGKRNEK